MKQNLYLIKQTFLVIHIFFTAKPIGIYYTKFFNQLSKYYEFFDFITNYATGDYFFMFHYLEKKRCSIYIFNVLSSLSLGLFLEKVM